MSRIKFDIQSEKVQLVLLTLKALGAISLLLLAPNMLSLFKPKSEYSQVSLKRTLYYLQRRGDVKIKRQNGQSFASITEQGLNRLSRLESFVVRPPKQQPKKWDGKWRIVIFDIPEKERVLRNAFRSKLRDLECVLLQGSVWVTPYDIKDQLRRLCEAGQFNRISVQHVLALSFDEEPRFRKLFKLRG